MANARSWLLWGLFLLILASLGLIFAQNTGLLPLQSGDKVRIILENPKTGEILEKSEPWTVR